MAVEVRTLSPCDLEDITRLHRFSSTSAGSVFGSRDLSEVLAAAAGQSDGAFGFVALLTDPEEPEEPEVVGALTAQCSSSSSHSAGGSSEQQAAAPCPTGGEVVLLTLVVRADARRRGVGAALLDSLLQHIQQQQHQHQGQLVGVERIVADVALANTLAWAFFTKAGFQQGAASEATAEAVLYLDSTLQQQQQQQLPGDAASSSAPSSTAAAALQANWQGCWLASTHSVLTPTHSGMHSWRQHQQQQQLANTRYRPGLTPCILLRRTIRPVVLVTRLHSSSCRAACASLASRCC